MLIEQNHGAAAAGTAASINSKSKSIRFIPKCITPLIFIFLDSIKVIFIQNPNIFFIIYTLGSLPLSLFLTSLSLSSVPRQLKSHIVRLEWLFHIVDIWVEAGNIRETSQLDLYHLYRIKLLHALPVLLFSLFTVVATVITVVNSPSKKKYGGRPGLRAVATALRSGWARPLVTCVVGFVFWVVWGHVVPILISAVGYPASWMVVVAAAVVEVYVMMVVSVGVVVSVAEERAGVDAIWAGSGLMKGRRVSGWVLSGLIVLSTNCIGREMVGAMDGQDLKGGYKWTVEMRVGYMIGLVILLGWVVTWSHVAVTIFYCDCKKRNAVIISRQDDQQLDDDDDNIEI